MNKANVLFIYPNKDSILRIPLAGAILCSSLENAGHNVKLLDTTFVGKNFKTDIEYSEKKKTVKKVDLQKYIGKLDDRPFDVIIKESLKDFSPDLIAVTVLERTYTNAKKILKTLKKYTKAPVLAGGIMASIAPDVLLDVKEIDMLCLGEGEKTIVEVCDALANNKPIDKINNLWVKKDKKVVKNPLRSLIQMEDVPEQNWDHFDQRHLYRAFEGKVYRNGSFEFSRGCMKVCSFCVAPQLRKLQQKLGAYHRFKKPSQVIHEIINKKDKYKLNLVHFGDTDFLAGMKMDILKDFVKLYTKHVNLPFLIQTGAETINEESMKLLKKAKCANISVGVESGSDKVRRKVLHKFVSKKRIVDSFMIARKYKVRMTANYMVGLPDETEEDIWETIKFNKEVNPPAMAAFYFTPFIGTELYDISLKKGYIKGFNPDSNLHKESPLKMPHLSQKRISELLNIFVDDFKGYQDEY